MQSPQLLKDQRGSTLIELMAAFFVISMGLMGAMALTTNNLKNERISANRLVATNLAREGVELARNLRDSNWTAGNPWDQGLTGVSAGDHCAVLDDSRTAFVTETCFNDVFNGSYRLYQSPDPTRVYSRNTNDTPTSFYRKVTFDPICASSGGATETIETTSNCPVGTDKIGVHVAVQVGIRAVSDSVVTLEESLYNWR